MTVTCPAIADAQFLSTVLAHFDCQAQNIGQAGYQAMAAAGSPSSLVLTGALTIFIAIIGYRLVLGEIPTLRDGLIAVFKIGVVLALATSWSAFRTVAYNVAMHAPAEVAETIGGASDLPGTGAEITPRLQLVADQLAELTIIGTGRPPNTDLVVGPTEPLTPAQQAEQRQRLNDLASHARWDPLRDLSLLSSAQTLYLTTVIATFAAVRLSAGLLLALAPLFAIFLLFDGTRGLFEGWLRGLAGAALGALALTIVFGVELALLGPWLDAVMDLRHQNIATPAVPVELLVLGLVFALTTIAVLIGIAKVAAGIRMPPAWRVGQAAVTRDATYQRFVSRVGATVVAPDVERGRAAAVADAVAATQRRERVAGQDQSRVIANTLVASGRSPSASNPEAMTSVVPLGRSFRRAQRRVSAGAARRDAVR